MFYLLFTFLFSLKLTLEIKRVQALKLDPINVKMRFRIIYSRLLLLCTNREAFQYNHKSLFASGDIFSPLNYHKDH